VLAGKTEAIVTIPQIGAAGGNIYVTVTRKGFKESNRIIILVPAE